MSLALINTNPSAPTSSVAVPIGTIGGAAVGGFAGYRMASSVARNPITEIATNGIAATAGGAIGARVMPNMPPAFAAGLGVEIGERLVPGEGITRIVADGVSAHAGLAVPEIPAHFSRAVDALAKEYPRIAIPAELLKDAATGAPKAAAAVTGAGLAVHANRALLAKAPLIGGGVGLIGGGAIGAVLIGKQLVIEKT